jgi:hypothetical protein
MKKFEEEDRNKEPNCNSQDVLNLVSEKKVQFE